MKKTALIILITVIFLALLAGLILYKFTKDLPDHRVDSAQNDRLFFETDDYFDEIVNYPVNNINPSVEQLDILLNLPKDQKFNDQAPFTLAVKSENEAIASIGRYEIAHASKIIHLPIELNEGNTTITAIIDFSYCGHSDQSLCYFKKVKLVIPIDINAAGSDLFEVKYEVRQYILKLNRFL